MTNLELLATIALLEFLAWGATDITYKIKLMRRMDREKSLIREMKEHLKHRIKGDQTKCRPTEYTSD